MNPPPRHPFSHSRPSTPEQGIKPRRHILGIVIGALMLVNIGAVFWSLGLRAPKLSAQRARAQALESLQSEVRELEVTLTSDLLHRETKERETLHQNAFSDTQILKDWLDGLSETLRERDVVLNASPASEANAAETTGPAIDPPGFQRQRWRIRLDGNPDSKDPSRDAYHAMVYFLKELRVRSKFVWLSYMEADGDGRALPRLEMELDLLVGHETRPE